MIRVQIKGDDAIIKELAKARKEYPEFVGAAMYKLAVTIIGRAIPRTPVEFGVLRASHYVGPPTGNPPRVELGYGTVYAFRQHEELTWRHPRGGEAKYLEKAAQSVSPEAGALVAGWVRERPKWGQAPGMPTQPTMTPGIRAPQAARLRRGVRNVRKKMKGG